MPNLLNPYRFVTGPAFSYDFENGTDGNNVATTDPTPNFDVVNKTGTATLKHFEGMHANGGKCARINSTSDLAEMRWYSVAGGNDAVARMYFRADSVAPGSNVAIMQFRTSAGSRIGYLSLNTSGRIIAYDSTDTIITGTNIAAHAISVDKWYRIELAVEVDTTTTGRLRYIVYEGNTDTIINAGSEFDSSTENLGSTAVDRAYFGKLSGTAANNGAYWVDGIAADAGTTYIGKESTDVVFDGFVNTFEGGTDTTILTQGSGGNTGGDSGEFFTNVSGDPRFTTDWSFHGTVAMEVANAAALSYVRENGLDTNSDGNDVSASVYFEIPAAPTSDHLGPLYVNSSTGGWIMEFQITNDTTPRLRAMDSALSVISGTDIAGHGLTLNNKYRLDVIWEVDTSAGTAGRLRYRVCDVESGDTNTAAFEFDSGTTVSTGTAHIDRLYAGGLAASARNGFWYLDTLRWEPGRTTYLGGVGV